ncbi:unnamed protein product [Adineta ricciae]|uniref:Carbonic anhydrase n=1 Tax=Adineta ricciae TaxID=249248 RepID=A0A814UPB9_ADIRI|nr:unnamed protein product [Adineta ricciae]
MNLRLFSVLFSLFICVSSNQWNYGHLGPDIWSDYYPMCAGKSQSPINILSACTKYVKLHPFKFSPSHNEKHYFTLKNNGHTVIGIINDAYQQSPLTLTGGGLNGTFKFVNFHLHWGENYKSGSEHQINGIKYAGEIHFVYTNPLTSQMAVLGIFMQSFIDNQRSHLKKDDQPTRDEWERYFDTSEILKSENDSIVFDLSLGTLMGDDLADFWRYQGSLTTPPCTEGVIWTIFKEPIVFLENQFKSFRDNIYFEDYRGPQPVYNRTVYRNFVNETLSSIPDYNLCSIQNRNNGPDVWSELYPTCGGQQQSPINILTACTTYRKFPSFAFESGYYHQHNFSLLNNGHTIVGTFASEKQLSSLRLRGGDLKGTFDFVNFHLHWGENHKSGSEHEINGRPFPGEIHFVYTNHLTNQTAVLGIFMKSTAYDNETENMNMQSIDAETRQEWLRFFDHAQNLTTEGSSTILSLNLEYLMGENLHDFWRYKGSLTTPPCTEGIIWTIFKEPIMFVESEFKNFRENIYFEDYRRPQPLYTRVIYRNFHNETLSTIPDYNCCPAKSVG